MRINDPHGLNSWFLVGQDSIDDYMLNMILEKKQVVDAAIDGIVAEGEEPLAMVSEIVKYLNKDKGLSDED